MAYIHGNVNGSISSQSGRVGIFTSGDVTKTIDGKEGVNIMTMGVVKAPVKSELGGVVIQTVKGIESGGVVTGTAYADVLSWGSIDAEVSSGQGQVSLFTSGDLTEKVTAGTAAVVHAWGQVNAEIEAKAGDVAVTSRKAILKNILASGSVTAISNTDIAANVVAQGGTATVLAAERISGNVQAKMKSEVAGKNVGTVGAENGTPQPNGNPPISLTIQSTHADAWVFAFEKMTGNVIAKTGAAIQAGSTVTSEVTMTATGAPVGIVGIKGVVAKVEAEDGDVSIISGADVEATIGATAQSQGVDVIAMGKMKGDIKTTGPISLSAWGEMDEVKATASGVLGDIMVFTGGELKKGEYKAGNNIHVTAVGKIDDSKITAGTNASAVDGSADVYGQIEVKATVVTKKGSASVTAGAALSGSIVAVTDASAIALGEISASVVGGRHAEAIALKGDTSAQITALTGQATAFASGGVKGDVWAWTDANITSFGKLEGSVTADTGDVQAYLHEGQDKPIKAGRDAVVYAKYTGKKIEAGRDANIMADAGVREQVKAGRSADVMSLGSVFFPILAGLDATIVTGGDIIDNITATAGDASVTANGEIRGNIVAGGSAFVQTTASITGQISAANDAAVLTLGDLTGDVTASSGDASVTVLGSMTSNVSAGRDATLIAMGPINGLMSSGRDLQLSTADQFVGNTNAGRHASLFSVDNITGNHSAGGNLSIQTWSDLSGTVNADENMSSFSAGDTTVDGAVGGDTSISAAGPASITLSIGGDAIINAADHLYVHLTEGSVGGGSVAVTGMADTIAHVATTGDIQITSLGALVANTDSSAGSVSVTGFGSVSAQVDAALNGSIWSAGPISISSIDVGGHASATSWASTAGLVVQGQQGASLFSYGDIATSSISSDSGPVTALLNGHATLNISDAGGDVSLLALDGFDGAIHSDGSINIFLDGDFDAIVDAGQSVSAIALDDFNATLTADENLNLFTVGDLTGVLQAGVDAWVMSYGSVSLAGLDAGHDLTSLWSRGPLVVDADPNGPGSGVVTAGHRIGAITSLAYIDAIIEATGTPASPGDPGDPNATPAIPAIPGVPAAPGEIGDIIAWGDIIGSISAADTIDAVRAWGSISASVTPAPPSPNILTLDEHDPGALGADGGLYPADPRLSLIGLRAAFRDGRQVMLRAVEDQEERRAGDARELTASRAAALANATHSPVNPAQAAADILAAVARARLELKRVLASDAHALDTQVNLTARANLAAKQQTSEAKKKDDQLIAGKTAGLKAQQAEVLATTAVFQKDADEREQLRGDLLTAQIADMNARTESRLVGWVDYRWRIMGHVADVPYESAKDFLTQFQENYKDEPLIEPHMMGIAQTAGGLGMFAAGAGLSATGLGALVGVPLMARGVDVVYHGGELALTGKASPTWLNQGLRKAAVEGFGASEDTAEWVAEIGEGIVDAAGEGVVGRVVQAARAARTLERASAVQRSAGRTCTKFGTCFVAGTQVIVGFDENGNPITKSIEEVQVGDAVLTRDQNDPDAPLVEGRVVSVFSRRAYDLQLVTVRDEDGSSETINATDNHPFYVDGRGWIEAAELYVGDKVLTADGRELTVTANVNDSRPDGVMVYNFTVAGAHTYFVADGSGTEAFVWVHNSTWCDGLHHIEPQYLGGPKDGELIWLPGHIHVEVHAKLDKALLKALPGAPATRNTKAWEKYFKENKGAKTKALEIASDVLWDVLYAY